MTKIWGLMLAILLWALYTVSQASLTLNFPDINISSFQNKFSLVHFMAPGNNFWGSIFWLASKSLQTPIHIQFTSNPETKTCTKWVRGLYFNSQRGKRLRPLDQDTLVLLQQQNNSYDTLTITWGLYTTCSGGTNNPYSVFGYIKYTRWGKDSHIVAGTQLDYKNNKMIPAFANSLQYFDNKVPLGYLYDSNGGIGYIWGALTGHEDLIHFLNSWGNINNWFTYSWETIVSDNTNRETTIMSENTAVATMRNLIIQWSVGLSKSINASERTSLLGNTENKTVILNGSDINASTLINIAKQKAQALCKWQDIYTTEIILPTSPENILCFKNTPALTINLNQEETYVNKTIIVQNGNVILQGGMKKNSPALDLFVDKWIVYLPTTLSEQHFDIQWFPTDIAWFNAGLYLKWNFIINGLIVGGTPWMPGEFNHKLHLQGKITLLNTPLTPSTQRITQILDILWAGYENYISLQNIFTRQCGLGGTGSDTTPCKQGTAISTTPLVILNGNYPSNIVQ